MTKIIVIIITSSISDNHNDDDDDVWMDGTCVVLSHLKNDDVSTYIKVIERYVHGC